MKEKTISFNYKKKRIRVKVKICNVFQEAFGLMFAKKEKARALLFNFKDSRQPIWSIFVFFSFIAIWLDKSNKVIEVRRVEPFTWHVRPKKPFDKLIEIPINKRYKRSVKRIL